MSFRGHLYRFKSSLLPRILAFAELDDDDDNNDEEEAVEDLDSLLEDPDQDELYIDHNWHGLHFLLTRTGWDWNESDGPLNFIMDGGTVLSGDQDDPEAPRAFDANETKAIAAALTPLTREVVAPRFDASVMNELGVHTMHWEDQTDLRRESLLACYESLRAFVATTAERGDVLVIHIC